MENMPEPPNPPRNWVERRAAREAILDRCSKDAWNDMRAAIQDACETYNENYALNQEQRVVCILENGKRVRIRKTVAISGADFTAKRPVDIVVSFDEETPSIIVTGDGPVPSNTFSIVSNETSVQIGSREHPIDPDEVSRRILEPLLFESKRRYHPARCGRS